MIRRPSGWLNSSLQPAWLVRLYLRMQTRTEALLDDHGQDLVEYAIVAALISLAAIVAMKSVATALGNAYTNLGTKVGTYIT
jgi:pilus assembly protein Flp/PilA